MQKNNSTRIIFIASAILLVAFTRFIPHPPNFTAIGAIAIFGGATLRKNLLAFLIPIVAIFLTDLVMNNTIYASYFESFQWVTPNLGWTMVAIAGMVLAGKLIIKKVNVLGVLGASIIASLLFFVVSNFGVWTVSPFYTKDMVGLISCYTAGIPFLLNTVLGTVVYASVLFGAYKWATIKFPVLAKKIA